MGIKIALNGQRLVDGNPAGPERFTINLYKALANTDSQNEYLIYVPEVLDSYLVKEIAQEKSNVRFIVVKSTLSWTHFGLAKQLFKDKPDVFFTPVHTLPVIKPRKTRYISMIHGLEYKTNKELAPLSPRTLIHPLILDWVMAASDKIIVPSQATKNAIAESGLCQNMGKVEIINEGVSGEYHPREEVQIRSVLDKYKLRYKKYLLFVSTIQPRKNVANLIQGYAEATKRGHVFADYELVLVGKLGWNFTDALEAPKKYGVEERVRFLNWVPQHDLPLLFSGARAYINLSYEEGFGLTVLEAEASGIPMVLSEITAHKEVGREFPIYVKPDEVNQICASIISIFTSNPDAEKLERASGWAHTFLWENTASKFISIFTSTIPR